MSGTIGGHGLIQGDTRACCAAVNLGLIFLYYSSIFLLLREAESPRNPEVHRQTLCGENWTRKIHLLAAQYITMSLIGLNLSFTEKDINYSSLNTCVHDKSVSLSLGYFLILIKTFITVLAGRHFNAIL